METGKNKVSMNAETFFPLYNVGWVAQNNTAEWDLGDGDAVTLTLFVILSLLDLN